MVKHKRSRGGGYSTQVSNMISPGNVAYQQYDGPGKDCVGDVTRSGFMGAVSNSGLPGLRGGRRRSRRNHGGTQLHVSSFADYTSEGDVPPPNPTVSAPGVADHPIQQTGGRYEMNPGSLVPHSAIGMSGPSPFARIACEAGTTNVLNPNMALQMATTAIPIRGGSRRNRRSRGGASLTGAPISGMGSTGNFPVVHVGKADAMAYNAPTAGYRNDFEAFPSGGAVPGLTLQVPYAAHGSNLACSTTGGSRRKRRGGAYNPADYAAPYSSLSMNQVVNRSDFDGSKGGLPVKYGGGRRSRRRSRRHSKKHHGGKRRSKGCFTSKVKRFFRL